MAYTTSLLDRRCVPCEGGTPKLTAKEADRLLAHIPEWKRHGDRIERTFRLPGFVEAVVFVQKVADVAEEEDHHPDIHIHYDRVRLELSTHAIGGLSDNDFILAAKIDALE